MDLTKLFACGGKTPAVGAAPEKNAMDCKGEELREGGWVELQHFGLGKVKVATRPKVRVAFPSGDKEFTQEDIQHFRIQRAFADAKGVKLEVGQEVEASKVPHWGGGIVREIQVREVLFESPVEGLTALKQHEIDLCGINVIKKRLQMSYWCC
eukprot:TRINITY_DN86022_c0_g1_i1.p2 TRINITY_DN86022_c0_g1~~TRINITY_DN86022_c0_g1_i1.p2  ORF type:complete len:153 (+),score=35.18 TRINITY_DN86022_c0_g1_i1:99-557(+)